jgi:hypothetical protein
VAEGIEPMPAQIDQQQLAKELVDKARADGVDLRSSLDPDPSTAYARTEPVTGETGHNLPNLKG